MLPYIRAAFAAVLVVSFSVPGLAADKAFKRDDLADAAIKLEAQIKAESGEVTKPIAALRREADAAAHRGNVNACPSLDPMHQKHRISAAARATHAAAVSFSDANGPTRAV